MADYPRTISSGSGEEITFVGRTLVDGVERLIVENEVAPGSGPPMHVHHRQAEALTVLEGRIGYQTLGGEERFAGPGETVAFKPGEAHRFWNAGDGNLLCSGHVEPADNVEYLLTELFESTKRNGGTRPDPFEAAFLMTRYRTEYAMLEIPAMVRRFVFPLLVAVGRLLGRYRRYADAPEPVRR
jgi:uncharacterized cupin superfamily protein